jgi:molybdate transport system substrate-binding protein
MASRISLIRMRTLFICLIGVLFGTDSFANDAPIKLHIAVASNFKQVHQALAVEFETLYSSRSNTSIKIISSSGSSGTLFAQIMHGAPYDVFLSADQMRPDTLIDLGLALKQNRTIYAQGQIVLWQPKSTTPFDINIFKTHTNKYVLANPKLAPYGAASKAIMKKSGFWHAKDPSRIMAQNIATAFQYLASGSIDIGWVAFSQLKSWEQRSPVSKHSYWLPPISHYPVIHQVAVQLERAKNNALAAEYLAYLSAPKAQTLIRSFGYLSPSI